MQFKDSINFLSKVNPRKAVNAAAVLSSFYLSRWTRRPIQWGVPFNVSIEPTTTCNLGCPECPSGLKSFTRPTGNMEYDFYQRMVDEIGGQLLYLYFYFQGEPYLHPRFL
ncbi:MAG: radical SAM protein, partial [Bacteroidetes bacterium]|nr:radical SAM protein [Bacteroidota bacterium]